MAHELNVPVSEVVTSGSGLAFVAYPDLVTRLPVSTLWALLFFLMLFTLGLDSQFAIVENIITCILDEFPQLRPKKPWVVVGVCVVLFLLGIPLTTQGGRYIIDLMDTYAAGWPYLFIGLMELIAMYWVYGVGKFYRDLENIQGFSPGLRLRSHITVVYGTLSPALISVILVLSWIDWTPLESGGYVYPFWANVIGWCMAIIIIAVVPLGFLADVIFVQKGNVLASFRETDEWYKHSENIEMREKAGTRQGFDNLAIDNNQFYEYNSRL
ncbi:Sodium- and chloride-dependent glycine transporter 2 [Amphibalanus amphitrite]|uniref:Sodium-and chloride-dependent glycine transporter 2 n=2 Tax=Amphibalanus amphitrite TaxID=1232801 RepID=A0A6A4WSD7_AMPAM|nr:Sodium- and chloride-dependent glycine transporter 2 [Amphibalanus amphitrite]